MAQVETKQGTMTAAKEREKVSKGASYSFEKASEAIERASGTSETERGSEAAGKASSTLGGLGCSGEGPRCS